VGGKIAAAEKLLLELENPLKIRIRTNADPDTRRFEIEDG
jgi:hypothetical protein